MQTIESAAASSDVVEQIRSAVETRLRELQPVITELERLQDVLAVLDQPGAARRLPSLPPVLRSIDGTGSSASVTPLRRTDRLGGRGGPARARRGERVSNP